MGLLDSTASRKLFERLIFICVCRISLSPGSTWVDSETCFASSQVESLRRRDSSSANIIHSDSLCGSSCPIYLQSATRGYASVPAIEVETGRSTFQSRIMGTRGTCSCDVWIGSGVVTRSLSGESLVTEGKRSHCSIGGFVGPAGTVARRLPSLASL